MEASSYKLALGSKAPPFRLPGTDGREWGLEDFRSKPAVVVAFTCNHCPYVQAYEGRIIDFQREFGPRGVQLVAINSNDAKNYPDDAFPHMVERAKAKGFNFPYLRDEDQSIARAYGAVCTPHFLLFDRERRLVYQGRLDDDKDGRNVTKRYLAEAAESALAGKSPPTPQTWALGCSIKWDTI